MAYPTLPIMRQESAASREAGMTPERATNGALKVRRLYPAEKTTFTLQHWISPAEKSTLEAHYQANKDLSFAFVWPSDGLTYTVVYGAAPQYTDKPGWYIANVTLLQT